MLDKIEEVQDRVVAVGNKAENAFETAKTMEKNTERKPIPAEEREERQEQPALRVENHSARNLEYERKQEELTEKVMSVERQLESALVEQHERDVTTREAQKVKDLAVQERLTKV